MKTDKWFYELFLTQPGMIAELLPGIEPDWEFSYSAPAVKEKGFYLDGVFTPKSEDVRTPLVFAEAQMQADEGFYWRYFAEIFLYLKQYRVNRNWRGLIIAQNPGQALGTELPYEDLLRGRVTRLYLEELREQEGLSPNLALLQLLVVEQDRGVAISRNVLKEAKREGTFQRYLSLIETILASKFPSLTTEEILEMLDLKSMDITQSRFYQEILQKGQEQGRRREALLIIRLLQRRLGELAPTTEAQILDLPIDALEALGEALLDFTAPADLEAYLENA